MRRLVILLALAALSLGGATAASATMCNIDFSASLSVKAYDFAIVLPTPETIVDHYNGTPGADDVFADFSVIYPGTGGRILHWTVPQTPIGNGTRIHVGWTTASATCPECVPGYFTDQCGNKIPGTDVHIPVINHAGNVNNKCPIPITLKNLRGACLSAPLGLADLNRTNRELGAQLQFLSAGATLEPGDDFVFPLPTPKTAADSCTAYVFTYDIEGQQPALISPWVQLP